MNTRSILDKLIRFETVPGKPTIELISWIADFLRAQGAAVEILHAQEEGQAALWARLGPDVPGGVVLAGHVDVVSTKGQTWSSDPFSLTERDGNLYGRGTCDMKGFIACALSFAERIARAPLTKPLFIALTYGEETRMKGAVQLTSWLKERDTQVDFVWLGEPTELNVVTAHKGVTTFSTTIWGVAAHASMPHEGLNAILVAHDLMGWIEEKRRFFSQNPFKDSPFTPPYTTINIGSVNGGTASNIVADTCVLTWEARTHPGSETGDVLRRAYEAVVDRKQEDMKKAFSQSSITMEVMIDIPPFDTAKDAPWVDLLLRLAGKHETKAVSYATEAGYFRSIARHVVICGPGSISQAHQPDEYVAATALSQCDALLDAFYDVWRSQPHG